jgi:hypothetical protein
MSYPYGTEPLRPRWNNANARLLAGLSVLAAGAALAARSGDPPDLLALTALLPPGLGFVLAFAPQPPTSVGRAARDLTVLGLALSALIPSYLPILLLCYPLLLALSVLLGTRASRFWR